MNVNIDALFGTMKALADHTHPDFKALGVTKTDFEKLTGETQWLVQDKSAVINTFKSIIYGTTDALGLDRVILPPEMVAAAIATIVSGVNRMVAAHWISTEINTGKPITAPDGQDIGFNKVSVATLMHLVTEAVTHEAAKGAREKMKDKMSKN